MPIGTPGVVVHDDWDALGMRASGSNSITFDGVDLPASGVRGGFPAGDAVPYMERNLAAGLFHASARWASPSRRTRPPVAAVSRSARARMLVAETAIDLAAARAVLARAATLIDEHRAANPAGDGSAGELRALFAEAQAAKAFVNEAAARVVARALALSGGAGYRNGSPLARAYRDVGAGAFMHPLGANRAYDHLADVALGVAAPCIEPRAFRDAAGAFATGVAFVTTMVAGEPVGLIVNSLASVSLEPPLVSFCASRTSITWSRMRGAGRLGVNILARHHEAFVRRAAPAGADRFAGLHWRLVRGAPLLTDAIAVTGMRRWKPSIAPEITGSSWHGWTPCGPRGSAIRSCFSQGHSTASGPNPDIPHRHGA